MPPSRWAEYVRRRSRTTLADRRILDALEVYQRTGVPIRVSRRTGIDPDDGSAVAPQREGARASRGDASSDAHAR